MILKLSRAAFVYSVKFISKVFYRTETLWITPQNEIHWEDLRLAVILNQTSLFEPLFLAAIPNARLWRAISRVVVPVADVTLNRPIAGGFFRALVPNAVPITRKRDDSWAKFMDHIGGDSLIVIFPEGRMKRKDGLDKHGKSMNVKGGVTDILQKLDSGKMLIAYSGGLHHVQAPGEWVPKLFQTIRISFEEIDIATYKKQMSATGDMRTNVIADLEARMKKYC